MSALPPSDHLCQPSPFRAQGESTWQNKIVHLFPLASFLVVLAAVVAMGANLWQNRILVQKETEENLHGIASALAQQTARTLQAIDLTLIAVADSLRDSEIDWQRMEGDDRVARIIEEKTARISYLRSFLLLDADGRLLHYRAQKTTSTTDYGDRPYFTIHKDNPHHGLFVSEPLVSHTRGDWIMPVSRRLERPDGSLVGVLVAVMQSDTLQDAYSEMDSADNLAISVIRNDGTLVIRHPEAHEAVGKPFFEIERLEDRPLGHVIRFRSPSDGVPRLYMGQRVPETPLIVLVGRSEAGIFAAWHRNVLAYLLLSPILLITCGGLSLALVRYMRRRESVMQALQQSEQRFRDFAAAASDRFWESDENHRFIWHSGTRNELIGRMRWQSGDIDLSNEEPWRRHKATLEARQPFRDFRYERKKPDGSARYRSVSGVPVFDGQGRFKGYRGTYADITDQVRSQQQATLHRERFLRAIENLAEGFALYDSDDRLVVCNTRFRELHKPLETFLKPGTPFEDFLREGVRIGFFMAAQGREEEWLATRLKGHRNPPNVLEVMLGGRWYEIREQSDKEGGTLFFLLNIHDQKTAELQNRALTERIKLQFESMPVACLIMTPEFTILDWNPAAERIFGYTREEMLGASPYDRMVPEEAKAYVQEVERRLHMGERSVCGSIESVTKNGELVTCEWFNTPMLGTDGRCIGFLCMAVDITEKRKAEEKLRQAHRMEAVGQLTGGIAHDFNNMLQVILGNSEILLQSLRDQPQLARWAEMTKTAAERGAGLTQRLLAFSRQQILAPTSVDLASLITDFLDLLKLTLGQAIQVRAEIEEPLAPLMFDVGQFENMLLNLALNARDAMPEGGCLTIAAKNMVLRAGDTELDMAPGHYVAVSFTDTGIGMPQAVVRRAFEPFFTTKPVDKGSGLGLSMVYGFVTQSGGNVKIESAVGIGTTVTLWFPCAEAPVGAPRRTAPMAHPLPGGSETIMVVEDDDMVRSYVTDQLRSLGYTVDEAPTGGSALAKLSSIGPVDLLFTDIVMPGGMSGRDLANEVRRRYPQTKILFTSGYAEKPDREASAAAIGAPLLTKPYFRQDLARRVRETLDAIDEQR